METDFKKLRSNEAVYREMYDLGRLISYLHFLIDMNPNKKRLRTEGSNPAQSTDSVRGKYSGILCYNFAEILRIMLLISSRLLGGLNRV